MTGKCIIDQQIRDFKEKEDMIQAIAGEYEESATADFNALHGWVFAQRRRLEKALAQMERMGL